MSDVTYTEEPWLVEGSRMIRARKEGRTVASVVWHTNDDGHIWVRLIAVFPEHRGEGIGSELCRRFVEGPGRDANQIEWSYDIDGRYVAGDLATEPIPTETQPFAAKAIADVRERGLVV